MTSEERAGESICQICGEKAHVWILRGYRGGRPLLGQFCMGCADQLGSEPVGREAKPDNLRLSVGSLLVFAGFLVGMLGIFGDYLGFMQNLGGFGWHLQTGIGLGALLVVLGALFRVDTLVVVGAMCLGLSVFAEVFGISGNPGFGWKRQTAVVIGIVLILAGFGLRRMTVKKVNSPLENARWPVVLWNPKFTGIVSPNDPEVRNACDGRS